MHTISFSLLNYFNVHFFPPLPNLCRNIMKNHNSHPPPPPSSFFLLSFFLSCSLAGLMWSYFSSHSCTFFPNPSSHQPTIHLLYKSNPSIKFSFHLYFLFLSLSVPSALSNPNMFEPLSPPSPYTLACFYLPFARSRLLRRKLSHHHNVSIDSSREKPEL